MYADYLRSEHWIELKKRFYASKRFKGCCFVCEKIFKNFHLHHKTYKWKGREKLQNLVALCAGCHKEVHFANGVKLSLVPRVLNGRVYELKVLKRNR